jgi:hypothetical protein
MKYCKWVLLACSAILLLSGLVSAQTTSDKSVQAYGEMLKKDVRTQKQSIVDQAMQLEAAQKSQFWSIYDEYQKGLNSIWDQRIQNIKLYADNYDKMTAAIADQLAVKMIDLEGQRTALKKKYYGVYKEKMGAILAARFLQVETTLGSFIDLQIASEAPIIQ